MAATWVYKPEQWGADQYSRCSTESHISKTTMMAWQLTSFVICAVVGAVVSQEKYGPYRGPPVVPVILPGGFLADTKEVAAAKEYFLNALAKTAAEVKDEGPKGYYNARPYQAPQPAYQQPSVPLYQPQPQPQPQLLAHRQAAPAYSPQPQRYTSPRPQPVYEGQHYDDGEYREDHQPQLQYYATSARPDPQVTPVILDNGYIADTAEVNAAKADHFAAVARAQEAVARAAERARASGYSPVYQTAAPAPPPRPQQSYADY